MAYGDAARERVDYHARSEVAAPRSEPRRVRPDLRLVPNGPCPEIDCLRDMFSPELIAAAERRALALGVGADEVMITAGLLSEDDYVAALARWLGTDVDPLDAVTRMSCPLSDRQLIDALGASTGASAFPLREGRGLTWVFAPRGLAARKIVQYLMLHREIAVRPRLVAPKQLRRFVLRHAADEFSRRAADELNLARPDLSAAPRRGSRWPKVVAAVAATALVAALAAASDAVMLALNVVLSAFFLAWIGFRISCTFATPGRARMRDIPDIPDARLPVYTVIAALYREAGSVAGLVRAIQDLDYPPEKVDFKLVLEADDHETREAVERLRLGARCEIVIAPPHGPRTKPKALNAALALARGTYTVIFDAEDRPEPGQLRHALDAFAREGRDVACVQACLTIDNTADSWLTRLFTAEYAGQFDVFLPSLAKLGLPLPLGGSSNHFVTSVLRKAGGWDAYNVTEDADLGMRLARLGYRSAVIDSTTYEEAPARFGPWLRQRTRWFKGWMQTWGVHMRNVRGLYRDLGAGAFFTFQFAVGGNVLAALIHPLFLAHLIYAALHGTPRDDLLGMVIDGMNSLIAVGGYLASGLLAIRGLARRGLTCHALWLVLMPLHWLLLSLAAWRALIQLIRDPYSWEKTEHGLARTSRLQE